MGCDLTWKAKQPDITKQKQASLFVHALLHVLNGKIGNLPYADLEIYNGTYSGYFLDMDTLFPKVTAKLDGKETNTISRSVTYETDWQNFKPEFLSKKKKLNFIGFTTYFWGKPNAINDAKYGYCGPPANYQFSFVFNNSPELPVEQRHELITIEAIPDFRWARYKKILENFKDTPKNPRKSKYAVYQKGAYVRNCSHPLLLILYMAKHLYIPDLVVSDDYNEFKEFEKRMEMDGFYTKLMNPDERWKTVSLLTEEILGFRFIKQNIHPKLKKTWGIDLD